MTRWLTIATVYLWALWMLSPYALSPSTAADLAAWLPRERLRLGLDLQGGTEVLFHIEAEDVVVAQMRLDAGPLGGKTRRAAILVPADAETLDRVSAEYPHYTVTNTEQIEEASFAVLTPAPAWAQEIEARTIQSTWRVLQERLASVEQATIAFESEHDIRFYTPLEDPVPKWDSPVFSCSYELIPPVPLYWPVPAARGCVRVSPL